MNKFKRWISSFFKEKSVEITIRPGFPGQVPIEFKNLDAPDTIENVIAIAYCIHSGYFIEVFMEEAKRQMTREQWQKLMVTMEAMKKEGGNSSTTFGGNVPPKHDDNDPLISPFRVF